MSLKLPDGHHHGRITLILSPIIATICGFLSFVFFQDLQTSIICFGGGLFGCLFGLIVDPDLDQEILSRAEWRMVKIPIIGYIVGSIWVCYWLPYALIMKHRGVSHWPIVGTCTRLLWLSPLIGLIVWLFNIYSWPPPPIAFVITFVIGLCASDIGHWARDILT